MKFTCYKWSTEVRCIPSNRFGFVLNTVKFLGISLIFFKLVFELCPDSFILELIWSHFWDHILLRDLMASYIKRSFFLVCGSTNYPVSVWGLFCQLPHNGSFLSFYCFLTHIVAWCSSKCLRVSLQTSRAHSLCTSPSFLLLCLTNSMHLVPFLILKPRNVLGSNLHTLSSLRVMG